MDILIRHAKEEDYRALTELFSQPTVIEGTLQLPFPAESLWKKRLAENSDDVHVLVAEVEGKVVGNLALQIGQKIRRRHAASIGMAVHDEWQRRGIGSKLLEAAIHLADNWLNLVRIELTVFVNNEAAITLYKKYGFVEEGVLKKYAFQAGELVDTVSMARIR